MKLYVAGHNQEESRTVAVCLIEAGHSITSRWLNEDFKRTSEYTDLDRTAIACRDVEDVELCDSLVLISSPRRVPGGKFVEAGVALALGKKVLILGHRENMLLYHTLCHSFDNVEDLIEFLKLE